MIDPLPLLAVILIFGTPLGVVWLALRYQLKKALATRTSDEDVAGLRDEIASLRRAIARLEGMEEQIADLTLQVDDVARAALPEHSSGPKDPGPALGPSQQ